jgi:3-dehydroquinate synthase
MQRDKKVAHGKLRFVLPTQLGHVELVDDIKPELAREILQQT